jgi:hypothetical protein
LSPQPRIAPEFVGPSASTLRRKGNSLGCVGFVLTRWAYSRPYFQFIGRPSWLDPDTWPVFGQDKNATPAAHSVRGLPGWKFLSPKMSSPYRRRARHVRPNVMCPPGVSLESFCPEVQHHAVLQNPWIAGICPQAKEASSSILSIQPGVYSAGGVESDEWDDTKSAAPAPHDIVQPGKLGRRCPLARGVGRVGSLHMADHLVCVGVYNIWRSLRL